MANTIKFKRSSTSAAVPGTSDLALGEIAMNTYDGKLFIKKDVGGTESIVEIGAGGSISIASSPPTQDLGDGDIYWDSNDGRAYIYYDDGNGNPQWVPLTPVSEPIIPGANVKKLDDISTSFDGQLTTFNLTVGSSAHTPTYPKAVLISLGGVIQEVDTDFTISGSQITFTTAPASGLGFFGLDIASPVPVGVPSDTGVTPGSYQVANITVNSAGQVTSASDGIGLIVGLS